MRVFSVALLAAIASVALTARARAASVAVVYDPGTLNYTTAITDFATTGNDMAGMRVHATYLDGSVADAVWAGLGGDSGRALATGYLLFESGDTFSSTWRLTNTYTSQLMSLSIDAGPGNTVFDTTFGGLFGTVGSARGLSFAVVGTNNWDITATYRDAVALNGQAPVGDLFRRLDIQFGSNGGLGTNAALSFDADTDNIMFAGDITPVPLPAAVWSGALLLGAFGVAKKVRKHA